MLAKKEQARQNEAVLSLSDRTRLERRLNSGIMEPLTKFFKSLPSHKGKRGNGVPLVQMTLLLQHAPDFGHFENQYSTYAKERHGLPARIPEKAADAAKKFFEAKELGLIRIQNREISLNCMEQSPGWFKLVCGGANLEAALKFIEPYRRSALASFFRFGGKSEGIEKGESRNCDPLLSADVREIVEAMEEGHRGMQKAKQAVVQEALVGETSAYPEAIMIAAPEENGAETPRENGPGLGERIGGKISNLRKKMAENAAERKLKRDHLREFNAARKEEKGEEELEKAAGKFRRVLAESEERVRKKIEKESKPKRLDIAKGKLKAGLSVVAAKWEADRKKTGEDFSKIGKLPGKANSYFKKQGARISEWNSEHKERNAENAKKKAEEKAERKKGKQLLRQERERLKNEKRETREQAALEKKAEKDRIKAEKAQEKARRKEENAGKPFLSPKARKIGALAAAALVGGTFVGYSANYYMNMAQEGWKKPAQVSLREAPAAQVQKREFSITRKKPVQPEGKKEEAKVQAPAGKKAEKPEEAKKAPVAAAKKVEKEIESKVMEIAKRKSKETRVIPQAVEETAENSPRNLFLRETLKNQPYAQVYNFIRENFAAKDGVQDDAYEHAVADAKRGVPAEEMLKRAGDALKTLPEEYRKTVR